MKLKRANQRGQAARRYYSIAVRAEGRCSGGRLRFLRQALRSLCCLL